MCIDYVGVCGTPESESETVRFLLEHYVNDSKHFTLGELKFTTISPDLPGF
jgi:hypothetical protein